jgi:hypothetical protein
MGWKVSIKPGNECRMPGNPLRGSSQEGCCGLGPVDGFTPTPERVTRWPTRTHGTAVIPSLAIRVKKQQAIS